MPEFRRTVILVALLALGISVPPFAVVRASPHALTEAEATVRSYLESSSEEEEDQAEGRFYVQGWRWHTMSLVHEAGRLHRLAAQTLLKKPEDGDKNLSALQVAADYVVGFNMKGLHSIERDLFFPWVRESTSKALPEKGVRRAMDNVVDQLERDRQNLEARGASLVRFDQSEPLCLWTRMCMEPQLSQECRCSPFVRPKRWPLLWIRLLRTKFEGKP